MRQHFRMFAAYNSWANDMLYQTVAGLGADALNRDMGAFFGSILATLNHILVADRIWMKRFTGEGQAPAELDTILYPEFEGLRAARTVEDRRIVDWVDSLDDKALKGRFSYLTVTDLRTISQRLSPALAHLFNHQTHHRGQVHGMATALGCPSPALDLIYFQRSAPGREFA